MPDTNTPTIQRWELSASDATMYEATHGRFVLYSAVEQLQADHTAAIAAKEYDLLESIKERDNEITVQHETIAAKEAECEELRRRLLTAAGDDLCRLTQEEIKAMSAGAVKIPPKEEFLASCERFHAQVAGESGVMSNCLTLAQLIAENAELRRELERHERDMLSITANMETKDRLLAKMQAQTAELEQSLWAGVQGAGNEDAKT